MRLPAADRQRMQAESGAENAPGLPRCAYRRHLDGVRYRCEAAEGATVLPDDCRACPIPDALAHPQACLYLIPLRHQNAAHFACPWYFSWAREATVSDWRELCFCSYWFPRGSDERLILTHVADRRTHYLRVLRGEEPRSSRVAIGQVASHAPGRFSHAGDQWRRIAERSRVLWRRTLGKEDKR